MGHAQEKVFELQDLEISSFKNFITTKDVVVVGEMHGTREVPAFVSRLVKILSQGTKSLTVALEIDTYLQNDLDEFLKTGNFDNLVSLDYFKYPDGRSSMAMGSLLKELRNIEGIKIVCFDIASTIDTEVNRDSLMGVNLASNYYGGKMVVLTGNLHANLQEGYWRPKFKSAVFHFKKMKNLNGKLISLNTYFNGGTIWNCMQDGCMERKAYANPEWAKKYGLKNFMVVSEDQDDNGYNGFVYFEKVTASKPLVN
jgi:hypothetical protein